MIPEMPIGNIITRDESETSLASDTATQEAQRTQLHISRIACQRCRSQKLKCSHERPSCQRCTKQKAKCEYAEVGERRKMKLQQRQSSLGHQQRPLHSAASREKSHATAIDQAIPRTLSLSGTNETMRGITVDSGHEGPAASNWAARPVPSTSSAADPVDENHPASTPGSLLHEDQIHLMHQASIPTDSYASQLRKGDTPKQNETRIELEESSLPPLAAGLALLEIYFARIYNASLLFWKPKIFSEYVEGQVPPYLLKAIFGTAALFLSPDHENRNLESMEFSELTALRIFHKRSLSWAKAASSEAMALAIPDPSLSVVQALEVLSPYWYGTGMPRCGDLSLALAYRCCVIMQYGGNRDGSAENDLSLEAELKRRCFWACWASMCIVASPEPYMRYSWSEIARVPLPATIVHSPAGPHIKLTEYMDSNWVASRIYGAHDTEEPPVSAAMMKMVGVWAKVQLSVGDSSSYETPRKVREIRELSDLATTAYESVSMSHRRRLLASLVSEQTFGLTHQLLFFDGLYHLSQITLYSTLVPLFSGSQMDQTIDIALVQSSAKAVIRHAWLFGGVLKDYLRGRVDVTYLSSLLGYCAFICGTVLLSFEISREGKNTVPFIPELREVSSTLPMVQMFVNTLDAAKQYWNVLCRPYEKLAAALKGATAQLGSRQFGQENSLSLDALGSGSLSRPKSQRHTGEHQAIDKSSLPQNRRDTASEWENRLPDFTNTRTEFPAQIDPMELNSTISIESQRATGGPTNTLGLDALDPYETWTDDWWNVPFTAAGNDQLAGFEPILLFRQAWEGLV